MAWLSIFVMMALSQQFVRGVTYLTHDTDNDYYKVPVPWGLYLYEGVVTEVCRGADLKAVCYESKTSPENTDNCIETYKKNVKALDEMARLLTSRFPDCVRTKDCKPLFGVFVDRKSPNKGAEGVVKNEYPVKGNDYRSEATNKKPNEGQAFALCGKKAP